MTLDILHVAETLKGGIASYLDEILPAQRRRHGDGRVGLLAPAAHVTDLEHADGLALAGFAGECGRPRRLLRMAAALRRCLDRDRPAVVHAHSSYAGFAARLVLRTVRRPPPLVYCAHGWAFDREWEPWKQFLVAAAERGLARWADAIVCISAHELESARRRGLPAGRLLLLPNAIGERPPAPTDATPVEWAPRRRRLLFVGRFDRQKGVDVFARAVARLGGEAAAFAVGSPVVGLPEALALPSNVTATGWLPRARVQAFLRSADVVVVPSRWEGFGLIALEAMRAGRPVVASRVGGLAELVVDGVTGRLVPPGSVDALHAALTAHTPREWRRMGEAGRERFLASYTSARLNAQLEALYAALAAGGDIGHLGPAVGPPASPAEADGQRRPAPS